MATTKPKKSDVLRVRLTKWENLKLQSYADNHGKTVSEVIRAYIHRLPVQGELLHVVTDFDASQR